jgi:hypothetical protein
LINFDYSVDPDVGGPQVDISGATALLTIKNLGDGSTFSFDPSLVTDNAQGSAHGVPGGYQNSEQLAFFPVDFRRDANFTYDVTFTLSNLPEGHANLSVENLVKIGSGDAVPEPASWALMMLGFGGIGAAMRRSRRTAAAATA